MFFIVTLVRGDAVYFLGLQPATLFDRPWTIVTNIFVHSGFWHIFANMFTLFFFGSNLSLIVGSRRFLLVYFAGGILGNILFIVLSSPFNIAIGASGAVFAIAGALAIMIPKMKVIIFPIPVPIPLWIAVIGGFLILSFMPGIAWQAHLGGLVAGLIAGYFFKRGKRFSY